MGAGGGWLRERMRTRRTGGKGRPLVVEWKHGKAWGRRNMQAGLASAQHYSSGGVGRCGVGWRSPALSWFASPFC